MLRRFLLLLLVLAVLFPTTVRALQAARTDYDVEFKKGYDALVAHKFPEGMASMRRCLELRPNTPLCAYNLACGHALQSETGPALEWFGKFVEWGGGYDATANMIDQIEKDTDFDTLRKDPRFIALVEKARAYKQTVDDYVGTAAVYVPESVAKLPETPLLVVLHASGSTKDAVIAGPWKQVADQLGCALVAPSARVLAGPDPKLGTRWFFNQDTYLDPQQTYLFDKSVTAAIDRFKKEHKIDRSRVFVAGEGDGAVVALRLGLAYPTLYKGVVACDALVTTGVSKLIQEKAPAALKAGLKVRMLVDSKRLAEIVAADSSKPDAATILADWQKQLSTAGFADALTTYARDDKDAGQVTKLALEALTAMIPKTAEAGAAK